MQTPLLLSFGLLLALTAPSAASATAPAPPSPPTVPGGPAAPAPPSPPSAPTPPAFVFPDGSFNVFVGRSQARLGAQVSQMSTELRGFFGAPEDAGILVQKIESGSAAEAAKVEVGDVLVAVDGHPIARIGDVRFALAARSTEGFEVVVIRKRTRKNLRATLPLASEAHLEGLPPDVREELARDLERVEGDRSASEARQPRRKRSRSRARRRSMRD